MAYVEKRRGSAIYTAFFYDEHGKRMCRSTHCTDRVQAERVAQAFEKTVRGKIAAAGIRKTILELAAMINPEQIKTITLIGWLDQWLEHRKKDGISTNTWDVSYHGAKRFLETVDPQKELELVTEADVIKFRDAMIDEGLCKETIHSYLAVIRQSFKQASRKNPALFRKPSNFAVYTILFTTFFYRPRILC
jgi:hypothetical protein